MQIMKQILMIQMRKLFTDHAVYTKFFIESKLHSLPDIDVITTRLLNNQDDIGNFVGKYVGTTRGMQLSTLLRNHILAIADVVDAIKEKNNDKIKSSTIKVFDNSKQVATFLSALNPTKLPLDIVSKLFNEHNQFVIDIATLHDQQKYSDEIKMYDIYYEHMLRFSDLLTSSIRPIKKYLTETVICLLMLLLFICIILTDRKWISLSLVVILLFCYLYYDENMEDE